MLNHRYTGETDDQVYGARQSAEVSRIELDPLSGSRVAILRDARRIIKLLRAGEATEATKVPQEAVDQKFSEIVAQVAEQPASTDTFDLSGLDSAPSSADLSEYLARLQA